LCQQTTECKYQHTTKGIMGIAKLSTLLNCSFFNGIWMNTKYEQKLILTLKLFCNFLLWTTINMDMLWVFLIAFQAWNVCFVLLNPSFLQHYTCCNQFLWTYGWSPLHKGSIFCDINAFQFFVSTPCLMKDSWFHPCCQKKLKIVD
jgi:hypothetical protein